MTIEVRRETKVEKWVREHKKELAVAGAIIVSFAIGIALNNSDDSDECTKQIDEDIFTNLAPTIEDAVLSDGIDGFYMARDYPVEFESGDTRLRRVSVSVKDMGMYEG